jgi:predicted glycoside hydrolase/deacetylase ChbG (UPF0249 family)
MMKTDLPRKASDHSRRKARFTLLAAAGILAIGALLCKPVSLSADETSKKRYLIVHIDDAGMSHSANMGTIDAMENGIASSTSIMVPCPWFVEFAKYAKDHPEKDCGIHLTLTCEWDNYRWGTVAPRGQVPSLVDEDGYMWDNVEQVIENVKVEEAEIELRAQIEKAKKFGVPITHLDTHMGAVISRPDLVEVYVKLGLEYDLPILFLRRVDPAMTAEYPALAGRAKEVTRLLDEQGLPVLDSIFQSYGGATHEGRRETYLRALRELPPGVSQIIIHCGFDDAELRAITSSASRRDGDRRIFSNPDVIAEIKKLGIEVITWKQFREMAAKK